MASKNDLTYTNNMASNKQPFLTDLEASLQSLEDYTNDEVKDNLLSLANDTWGTAYVFDDDGAKNFTNDLYNKQNGVDSYTGGDITIAATGSWTDVDATNASITLTPELVGDFLARVQFSVESVSSNATNETDVRFRLTDSSTNSTMLPRVKLVTGVTTTTNTVPLHLSYSFVSLAASSQTIKLQYFISTSTNTTIKVLANTNDPILLEIEKV